MTQRTLIIQPLPGLGDMLWYMPYLKTIARNSPDHKVSILTKRKSQSHLLLKGEEFIEQIYYLEDESGEKKSLLALIKELRGADFARSFTLHHSMKYDLLCLASGIHERHGYGFGLQKHLQNSKKSISKSYRRQMPIPRAQALMDLYGYSVEKIDLTLKPSKAATLPSTYSKHKKPWITLGVGASQVFKQWPTEKFAELVKKLEDTADGNIFLLAHHSEQHIVDAILNLCPTSKRLHAATNLRLDQAITLLSQSRFFIGNCSGPLNIAASVNIPAVGLFATTEVLDFNDNIISVTPSSAPTQPSMNDITVTDVLQQLSAEKLI